MVFVKQVKTSAYFSRFQVKPRRRREGKTDYQARRALVTQDKTKYNSPKYRLVVRFTNTRVICQVIYATIQGDRVVSAADSTELKRYGMPVGLTNYSAAYATGLLLARRTLKKFGLDETCKGVETANGELFHIEEEETDRRPFKCALDIGLVHTTTGHRVFGAMKGAVDGGLHVPHSEKRFPGYSKPAEGGGAAGYDAAAHRARIFGVHVAEYMKSMEEENKDKYDQHFSRYIAAGITGANLEETVKKVHAAIRANPDHTKVEKQPMKNTREGDYIKTEKGKYYRPVKLTRAQRKERVQEKIGKMAAAAQAALAAAEED